MTIEHMGRTSDEFVVLLDAEGTPIGTTPRSAAHGPDTAAHLSFSCHVVNPLGQVLVTRRALSKATWPGVWTNSFCGNPKPAETLIAAVHRRAEFELGISLDSVELGLPLFRYRARDASGKVENEVSPVYFATTTDPIVAHPSEVSEWAWMQPRALAEAIHHAPFAFSPWLGLQVRELELYRD